MSNTTWPQQYTAVDIETIENIFAWIESRKYTQAALARLARTSASSLNQILKGNYPTSPAKILASIVSAMTHADESTSDTIGPVDTGVFKLAIACCRQARQYRNFAVFTGFVGTGKTFGLKHYAATHSNTYLIESTPTMTTNGLIKRLARSVTGYDGRGSIDDKFLAIVDTLDNTDSLLIIDEAETLTPNCLHALRRIQDLASIGIVLAGTEYLTALIKPLHGQFDQIRSRCGFWPPTIERITEADAAALVQAAFGSEEISDEVIQHLYKYSKGSARMLTKGFIAGIKKFRDGRELNVKLVDAVAKQALCLQAP